MAAKQVNRPERTKSSIVLRLNTRLFFRLLGIYVGMKVAGVAGMILGPILILVVLNLVGLGIFQGFWMDVTAAARDITAILSQRPERK